MIADVRCVVASATGSRKCRYSAGHQASCRHIVIDASNARDIDGRGIEQGLAACNRRAGFVIRLTSPDAIEIKNVGSKLTVTGLQLPTRLFEDREQKVDARVDADKERLGRQSRRPALGAIVMEVAGATVFRMRGEELHFEAYDLLLLLRGGPRSVSLYVNDGGVD